MNLIEILPYFHIFVTFFYLYPLIIPKNVFWDKIYLLVLSIVVLNWTVMKGECTLSYIWKKSQDKNYKMGSKTIEINDIKTVLPFFDEKFVIGFFGIFMSFVILLFGYTANRSKILPFKIYSLFIITGIYILLRERKFFNEKIHESMEKYYIIDGLNIISVLIILLTIYKTIKA